MISILSLSPAPQTSSKNMEKLLLGCGLYGAKFWNLLAWRYTRQEHTNNFGTKSIKIGQTVEVLRLGRVWKINGLKHSFLSYNGLASISESVAIVLTSKCSEWCEFAPRTQILIFINQSITSLKVAQNPCLKN